MKRIILSFFVSFIAVTIYAQTESFHLTFKGVPIDGTLSEFTSQLKVKGFNIESSYDGVAVLYGDFAGYKNCRVIVSTLNDIDLVSKIGVYFPSHDNWSSLETNYTDLKSMLTTKYGAPNKCVEEFQRPYSATDDNSRFWELRMNRCDYLTIFNVLTGDIALSLTSIEGDCYVLLCYFDYLNSKAVKEAAIEDL